MEKKFVDFRGVSELDSSIEPAAADQVNELDELQLTYVGGGIGDTVL